MTDKDMVDPATVLDCPMGDNDAGAFSVRGYLRTLLAVVWADGDHAIKRPFGSSGWRFEVYKALGRAGLIDATFDEDGYLDDYDDERGHALVAAAIESLTANPPDGEAVDRMTPKGAGAVAVGATARDWVRDGQWVEACQRNDPEWVQFAGEVIGFHEEPTVVIRTSDGTARSWPVTLCRPARRDNPDAWMDSPGRAAFKAGLTYARSKMLAGSVLSKLTPAEAFHVWTAIQRGAERFEAGRKGGGDGQAD